MTERTPSPVEGIKKRSDGLRGTLPASLQNQLTGAVSEEDKSVIKFHGIYEQDNRDRREERAKRKLEKEYSFMIRLRLPGGLLSSEQWAASDDIASAYSTGVIKITTRQTIQLHGIIKSQLKPTLKWFGKLNLDSIAACGDVNRNVVCTSHPDQSPLHAEIFAYADKISTLLLPKTRSYYEIWLDEEKIVDKKDEEDPLYKDLYLPRKFKIAIVIPPNNDVDVFANDIGLIAIEENGKLAGFNIVAGGGMSATHGNATTYPRVASVIGFTDTEEKTMQAIYEIVAIQRDFGNRSDRKKARLRYTIDEFGLDWFKKELNNRLGYDIAAPRPYSFNARTDYYGWVKNHENKWYYTAYVENGLVGDFKDLPIRTAFRKIAETGKANFRFTANQNVIVSDVKEEDKAAIHAILEEHNLISSTENRSGLRKNAIACVALPTCPLALAEAQRYLPSLVSKIEPILADNGLLQDDIIIRMTGCPNGCARPYLAEIAFVGTGPGHYNLHLGGDVAGERLNVKHKENINEETILETLKPMIGQYASERNAGESFGDFVIRKNIINTATQSAQAV